MGSIKKLLEKVEKIDPDELLNEVLAEIKTLPPELMNKRLNSDGKDARGKYIKTIGKKLAGYAYSPGYVRKKAKHGGQVYNVDLNFNKKWQDSVKITIEKDGFFLNAPEHGVDKLNIERLKPTLDTIMGLSDAEIKELIKEIKPLYIKEIRAAIGL